MKTYTIYTFEHKGKTLSFTSYTAAILAQLDLGNTGKITLAQADETEVRR